MALRLITPPAGEVVSLTEAKKFMRVDHTDDDDLISALIVAAREHIEGPQGRMNFIILTQTWELVLDAFPSSEVMIPLAPVQSIDTVGYYDTDGAGQTVDPSLYFLDSVSRPPYLLLTEDNSWPDTLDAANSVMIRFVAGFEMGSSGSDDEIAGNVPATVKLAVKQLVSHWYERRDLVSEAANINVVPEFVWQLLHRYRMFI